MRTTKPLHDWPTLIVSALVIGLIVLFVWLLRVEVSRIATTEEPVEARLPPTVRSPPTEATDGVAGVIA